MATPAISFNPMLTTVAGGSFNTTSDGHIQGTAYNDPAIRNLLSGGVLSTSETLPMWGGVAISEFIAGAAGVAPGVAQGTLGTTIARATQIAIGGQAQDTTKALSGFAVFDQMHSWINTPQSPVPTAAGGMGVAFYRLGSNARIAVAMDPTLVDMDGYLTASYVSWDFNTQRLQPYDASTATYALSSMTWGAAVASGGPGFTIVASVATLVGKVGDVVNISGATGNLTANGTFYVTAVTDNEHFIVAAPNSVTGAVTGSPVINAGTGILPVKVLETNIGTSMTVDWDSTNNVATWNRSGSTAIILI